MTTQLTGFVVRSSERHRVLEHHDLELPPSTLDTTAVWWTFHREVCDAADIETGDLAGALHAAEHAGIGILPLFAICDRWDVGGISSSWLSGTEQPTVLIHDGHPGGSGVAPLAFASAGAHLGATLDVLERCDCTSGCPSCVQSPKCGNGNEPLNKAAATALLRTALGQSTTITQ